MKKHLVRNGESVQKRKFSIMFLNLRRKLLCYTFDSLEFLAAKNNIMYRFHRKWIGTISTSEFSMAHVTSHETVLHIGCGALPTMSILAAKKASAKVIAIDNNPRSVLRAQRYIGQHTLTDLITVSLGDGVSYPVEPFDVIFIAINVTPIEDVFRHLDSCTKPTVRIICRDMGDGILHLLQSEEFSRLFTINAQEKHLLAHSLLITKNA
jgi:ubiquinone/menaquinone biosynthesis C-methylase UbiE